MRWSRLDIVQVIGALLIMFGVLFVAGYAKQSDFIIIISFSAIAFLGYAMVVSKVSETKRFFELLGLGIAIRFILLYYFPALSDDIYRFIWDGFLIHQGMNPYHHLPSSLVVEGFRPEIFALLNSPDYYTIYPPLSQLIFYLSTFVEQVGSSAIMMKGLFIVFELFGFFYLIRLLKSLNKSRSWALVYFLNPLVLIEGVGNLHFEVLMLSCFIASLYYIQVGKMRMAGLFYAASIAFKLIPLMFLPYLFFALRGRPRLQFFTSGVIACVMLFLPILLGLDLSNYGASLDLYFQKFEFNASIYYVLRFLGKLVTGYNLIQYLGPILAITVIFYVFRISLKQNSFKMESFLKFCLITFSLYLFLATTVHPWYLCTLILLASLTSYKFPLIWSGLILLSYINYSYDPYWENLYVIAIEYALLFCWMIYELDLIKWFINGKRNPSRKVGT